MTVRLFVLGLEGVEPQLLRQMMALGELPHLSSWAARGRTVRLENFPAMSAGVFWPSTWTGVDPSSHGRYFALQPAAELAPAALFDPDRGYAAPPVWDALYAQGRRCLVVDLPRQPLGELKHGVALCDWLAHESTKSTRSSPPAFAQQVEQQSPGTGCLGHGSGTGFRSIARPGATWSSTTGWPG